MMLLTPTTDILTLIEEAFPHEKDRIRFEPAAENVVRFRYRTTQEDIRPGDTVSGPTLMTVSDLGMFFALAAERGPVVVAVTSNLNINFLRRPRPGELIVESKLLKHGKRLAVGEVLVFDDESRKPVSHATVTYAIPDGV